jgi:hypothetical protein
MADQTRFNADIFRQWEHLQLANGGKLERQLSKEEDRGQPVVLIALQMSEFSKSRGAGVGESGLVNVLKKVYEADESKKHNNYHVVMKLKNVTFI